jgi:hypothetical protein
MYVKKAGGSVIKAPPKPWVAPVLQARRERERGLSKGRERGLPAAFLTLREALSWAVPSAMGAFSGSWARQHVEGNSPSPFSGLHSMGISKLPSATRMLSIAHSFTGTSNSPFWAAQSSNSSPRRGEVVFSPRERAGRAVLVR